MSMWIFVGILIVVYGLILTEKIPRVLAALIGAIATTIAGLVTGLFSFENALHFIDLETLFLIVGIFIIVEVARESGLFQFIAIQTIKRVGESPARLLLTLCLLTFLLTAIIGNIVSILIIGSLTMIACDILEYDPIPYMIAEILVANTSGMALVTSSIPSIFVAAQVGITFSEFAIIGFPLAVILLLALLFVLRRLTSKKLVTPPAVRIEEIRADLDAFDAWTVVSDTRFFYSSAAILFGVIILFVVGPSFGITIGFAALIGAAAMLLLSGRIEESIGKVRWETILFFIGLFITVGGVEAAGVLSAIAGALAAVVGGNIPLAIILLVLIGGLLSGIVDNIPVTLTFLPVTLELSMTYGLRLNPLVWSILSGALIGGNLLPIGSPSGIIASDILKRSGKPLSLANYLKYSGIILPITLGIAIGYVMLVA